ncbi:MAG: hypothetical protein Q7R40_12525 [Phaeospirillum sp.]|nr:hypothetical protein [Phaeospirillum sp.]
MDPAKRYLRLLLSWGLPALLASFVLAAVHGYLTTNFWIFRCTASGYDDDSYLSYCGDPAYVDYAHGALFIPAEPDAIQALRRAEVVFLGNSRAEIAFSAQAIATRMAARGMAYYNLAVYGEQDAFPRRILQRFDLHPRIIVVNVDEFFGNTANITGKRVMGLTPDVLLEYRLKAWVQPIHRRICGGPDGWAKRMVCGEIPAQFRSRSSGRVRHVHYPDRDLPMLSGTSFSERSYAHTLDQARAFKAFVEARGACLVLTHIPTPTYSPQVAARLAQDLGLPDLTPTVTGLTSMDGTHLSLDGAERWSTGFLALLEPELDRCRSGGR